MKYRLKTRSICSHRSATRHKKIKGDIAGALKEMGSKENVKGLATAVITAGLVQGIGVEFGLNQITAKSPFINQLGANLVNGVAGSLVSTAINGGSLEDNLKNAIKTALISTAGAQLANGIGNITNDNQLNQTDIEKFANKFAHAVLGCAIGAATADSKAGCGAGALGAVAGSLGAELFDPANVKGAQAQQFGKLTAALAVMLAGGDAKLMNIGGLTAVNAVANNRQLHQSEAQKLAALKVGKTPEEQRKLDAAACALVNCANGIPESDPNYAKLQKLQLEGQAYKNEQKALLATGEFIYQPILDTARDTITRNNELVTRTVGAGNLAAGSLGTVGGGAIAAAGIPACTTIAGCALIPLGTGIAVISNQQAQDGNKALFGSYASNEGQRVLDSFNPLTYPGERDPLLNLGLETAKLGLTVGLAKAIPKGLAAIEGITPTSASAFEIEASLKAKQSYESIEKFGAKGVQVTPETMNSPQAKSMVKEYMAAGATEKDAIGRTQSLIQTGVDLPSSGIVGQGVELIKLMPKTTTGGDNVSTFTPFFVTRQEYDALSKLPADQIAQRLGLPAETGVRGSQLGFDVYSMTPQPGTAPKVFVSNVAPIQQGTYTATGGAQQILVPNRTVWTEPIKFTSIIGTR